MPNSNGLYRAFAFRCFDTAQGQAIVTQILEYASPLQEFVEDYCVVGPDHYDGSKAIFYEYNEFVKALGEGNQKYCNFVRDLFSLLFGKIERKRKPMNGVKTTILKGIRRKSAIEAEARIKEVNVPLPE